MKKITAKLITVVSQVLAVSLFLILLFSSKNNNIKVVTIDNNNFNKMADSISFLFEKEKIVTKNVDNNVVVELDVEEEIKKEDTNKPIEEVKQKVSTQEELSPVTLDYAVLEVHTGNLTGYGPDCSGCSGKTRSGYNLNDGVYYNDPEFGTVRIIAADKNFGKNAIFRISNVPGMDPFIAIVLDTGGNVGFGKGTLFDLAFETENDPNILGLTRNVTFELLRLGESW